MTDTETILGRLQSLEDLVRTDLQARRQAAFTVGDAALYLGLKTKDGKPNVSAVRELCRQKKLAYSKPGKHVLIRRAELDRLLERTQPRHPLKAVSA
jgi:excisionase family DNA binding protein